MGEQEYYIWSFEHSSWWKPNEFGYTRDIDEAGIYSSKRAHEILGNANYVSINEALIPVPEERTRSLWKKLLMGY